MLCNIPDENVKIKAPALGKCKSAIKLFYTVELKGHILPNAKKYLYIFGTLKNRRKKYEDSFPNLKSRESTPQIFFCTLDRQLHLRKEKKMCAVTGDKSLASLDGANGREIKNRATAGREEQKIYPPGISNKQKKKRRLF